MDPSKCEIDVHQVNSWHSTSGNKTVLLEHSNDVAKIVAAKMIRLDESSKKEDSEEISEEEDSAESSEEDSFRLGNEEENGFHIKKV